MSLQAEAEEHLRIIRGLMERSASYRAISAPTALVGGVLALAASGAMWMGGVAKPVTFTLIWLGVLLVVAVLNTWFLYREAERRGEAFFSSGMKTGLVALFPPWITAGVLTGCSLLFGTPRMDWLVSFWIVFYALGLLATAGFAPSSIVRLGWAFLVAGLTSVLLTAANNAEPAANVAHAAMGTSFGALHLVYGFLTLRSKAPETTVD